MPRPALTEQMDKPGNRALRRGRVSVAGQIYHVTSRATDHTRPFQNAPSAFEACRAIHRYFLSSDANCCAWVLMPDHAHWLIELGGRESLADVVGTLKQVIAASVNRERQSVGEAVWQRGFHDRALRRDEDILAVARYVVANPLRAGIAPRLADYPWWNAIWL